MDNRTGASTDAPTNAPTWKLSDGSPKSSPEPPMIERRRAFTPPEALMVENRESPEIPQSASSSPPSAQKAPQFVHETLRSMEEMATADRHVDETKSDEQSTSLTSPLQSHGSQSISGIGTLLGPFLGLHKSAVATDDQVEKSIPTMTDPERTLTASTSQHDTLASFPYPQGVHSFDTLVRNLGSGKETDEMSPARPNQHDTQAVAEISYTEPISTAGTTQESQPPPRKKTRKTYSAGVHADAAPVSTTRQSIEDSAAMQAAIAVVERDEGPATRGGRRRTVRHSAIYSSNPASLPTVPASKSAASAPRSTSSGLVRKTAKTKEESRRQSERVRQETERPQPQNQIDLSQPLETKGVHHRTRGVAVKLPPRKYQSAPAASGSATAASRSKPSVIRPEPVATRSQLATNPSPPRPMRHITRHNHTPNLNSRYRDISSDDDEEDTEDDEGDHDTKDYPEISDSPILLAPPRRGRSREGPRQRRVSSAHGHGAGYRRLTGHVTDEDPDSVLYAASLLMQMGEKQRVGQSAIRNVETGADKGSFPKLVVADTALPLNHTPSPVQRVGFDGTVMVPSVPNPSEPVIGERIFGGVVAGADEEDIAAGAAASTSLEEDTMGQKRKADSITEL